MAKRNISLTDPPQGPPQKRRTALVFYFDFNNLSHSLNPVFSIFNPSEPSTPFVWKKNLNNTAHFLTKTCLYGESRQPAFTSKVAAFDLDDTLTCREKNSQWRFWHKKVPSVLKDVHASGFVTTIFITIYRHSGYNNNTSISGIQSSS